MLLKVLSRTFLQCFSTTKDLAFGSSQVDKSKERKKEISQDIGIKTCSLPSLEICDKILSNLCTLFFFVHLTTVQIA